MVHESGSIPNPWSTHLCQFYGEISSTTSAKTLEYRGLYQASPGRPILAHCFFKFSLFLRNVQYKQELLLPSLSKNLCYKTSLRAKGFYFSPDLPCIETRLEEAMLIPKSAQFISFTFIILAAEFNGTSANLAGYLLVVLNAVSIFGRTLSLIALAVTTPCTYCRSGFSLYHQNRVVS